MNHGQREKASAAENDRPVGALTQPRVVMFGSGSPLSLSVLKTLSRRRWVLAVVVPKHRHLFQRWRKAPLTKMAGSLGIPIHVFGARNLAEELGRIEADLFCIASFPRLLQGDLLALPRLGVLNVHPSLLPRHRGSDPLFWTYFNDDHEAGATIHWANSRADAGDIVCQVRMPLDRCRRVEELYVALAERAAQALATAIEDISRGTAVRLAQDESLASYDPPSSSENFRVPLHSWPVERLWHFLSGVGYRRSDLLRDSRGNVLLHGRPLRMNMTTDRLPGTIERTLAGYRMHCLDGWVEVAAPSVRARMRQAVRRFLRPLPM